MKKIVGTILVLVLVLSFVGFGDVSESTSLSVGWIYVEDGFDDIWRNGIRIGLDRAVTELDIAYTEYPVSGDIETDEMLQDELEIVVNGAALENDVILVVSFMYNEVIHRTVTDNEETIFMTIDSFPQKETIIIVEDEEVHIWEPYDNVFAVTFNEEEMGFLAGLAAGHVTKKDSVGFIGGMDFDLINRFEYGFYQGVEEINKKSDIYYDYADSFNDKYKGFYYGTLMNQINDVDVIFHAAGATGEGLFESAEVFDYWAIGVDVDQSHLAPNNVLCSVEKQVDLAALQGLDIILNDDPCPVHYRMGIKEIGVEYSDLANNLTAKTKKMLDAYISLIKNDEYEVDLFEE